MKVNVLIAIAYASCLLFIGQASASPISVVDQQSFGGTIGFVAGASFGQSFTPSFTSIDAAEFQIVGFSDARLDLYEGSGFGGALLASSADTPLAALPSMTHFDLTTSPTLTPGSVYTMRVVGIGTGSFLLFGDTSNPYAGGSYFHDSGNAWSSTDSKFSEGVPEPATMSLLALGGLAILRKRRRRS